MARDVTVCVRFTAEEMEYIDDVRDRKTRSSYIREVIALERSVRRV